MRVRMMRHTEWTRGVFLRRLRQGSNHRGLNSHVASEPRAKKESAETRNAAGQITTRMGLRVAGNAGGGPGDLRAVCGVVTGRAPRGKRPGPGVRCGGIRIHVVCGGASRAEASSHLATGARQGLDARALVAGAAGS